MGGQRTVSHEEADGLSLRRGALCHLGIGHPGPNNIMVMSAGANFGVRGACPAHGDLRRFHPDAVAGGAGLRPALYPLPRTPLFFIKCAGTPYLLYLAWLIARPAGEVTGSTQARPRLFKGPCSSGSMPRPGWSPPAPSPPSPARGPTSTSRTPPSPLIFFIVSFPCVGLWLLCGALLKRWLADDLARRRFQIQTMAALLVPLRGARHSGDTEPTLSVHP